MKNASPPPALVAACLFCSGLCALIYQTTWLREFRLIFGASTAASAAVLAIFMGGVGWGSLVLGKRADRTASPLGFYGRLELLIAIAASVSPLLLSGARAAYLALGGMETLGASGATCARLFLGALVLGLPTFLMGGTLPTAIAAMHGNGGANRKSVAVCYAANSAGAVAGVLLATFWLVEHLGNRATLWIACGLNVAVALGALALARRGAPRHPNAEDERPLPSALPASNASGPAAVAASGVYAAAGISGFTFFLMELVWYRMLAPILGGSTFTFGIILAIALTGIALGSLLAAWRLAVRPPTANAFAWLCCLQALCLAVPFALGDRLAAWAMLSQPLGQLSFAMRVFQWSATTAIVVLPASVVAGAQFPLLIALLGRGREALGQQTGSAYAWNTLGAISGSLAGGFGLLPVLTAPGAWRLYDLARLRQRIGEYPFNEALSLIWYVNDLEGVFSRFIAGPALARSAVAAGTAINTDDHNRLEYALARSVGRETGFSIGALRQIALANGWQNPSCVNGELGTTTLRERRATDDAVNNGLPDRPGDGLAEAAACRMRAKQALTRGNIAEAGELWDSQPERPRDPFELLLVALTRAARADTDTLESIAQLRRWRPLDADAVEVHYLWHSRRFDEAVPRLEKLLLAWRESVWADETMIRSTLKLIQCTHFPGNHRREALQLYHALQEPFAVNFHENDRMVTWMHLAQELDADASTHYTEPVLAALEPHFPWVKAQLAIRARCYGQMQHPLAAKARAELAQFAGNEAARFAYEPWPAAARVSARE